MTRMINADGTRRDFLRETFGRLAQEVAARTERRVVTERYFRPPGAIDEIAFLAACTRCNECIEVCPVNAIVKAPPKAGFAAGTPVLEPAVQPCVACPDIPCAAVCPTEALILPEWRWEGYAMARLELIPESCIAFQGSECCVCVRACPIGEKAIVEDETGRPVIKAEGCVGCGVCVKECVTRPSSFKLHVLES
ncbi:MAG: 4Fe-4S dicluster domain-containing protein [Gemmatimonadetes bacterium]|nr:4Fe-4S dicluster domain-containing protein [Gemmatimonadota bacterium]